jgi:hypothetical protein
MLEKNPIWSGLLPEEQFLVDAARQQRLAGLFGSEIAEIAELKGTIEEANAIADLAQVDLKLHSEMDDRTFTEFMKQTTQAAPWLIKDGYRIVRVRPEMRGTAQLHQPATPEEIRDGVFFESYGRTI